VRVIVDAKAHGSVLTSLAWQHLQLCTRHVEEENRGGLNSPVVWRLRAKAIVL
jgi:hypothetical protein